MPRLTPSPLKVFTAQGATGTSAIFKARNFRNIIVILAPLNALTATVKLKGGGLTVSDLTLASSGTNPWSFIQMRNLNDDSAVVGATGVGFVASAAPILLKVDADFIDELALEVTAWTSGTLDAYIVGVDY